MTLPLPSPKHCAWTAFAFGLFLSGCALWFAPLNQDEGWYLLSARRTAEGAMPYRDYAFTQGPVFPYVYSLIQPLVDTGGLQAGRVFTLLLGWASILVTAWTVFRVRRREDPWFAVCLVLVLLGLNTFHAQYLATVKTYSLAGLLLAAGLGCYLLSLRHRTRIPMVFAALFLALATATRLSLILFIPALLIHPFLARKQRGQAPWLILLLGSLGFGGLLFLPFLIQAGEGVLFGLVEYHQGRVTDGTMIFKAAFLSQFCLAYLPCALLALPILAGHRPRTPGVLGVLGGVCAVSLLHLLSPFPYQDYQVVIMPGLVLFLAIQGSEIVVAPQDRHRSARLLLAFGLLFALSSPQWKDWFSSGRDRIWWGVRSAPPLAQLQQAASELRALNPEADTVFTCDPYLAVEAGLNVPVIMNMGAFGFFPDMETGRAERLRVLNTERLEELLDTNPPPLAALSGYAFAIQSPAILPTEPKLLERIYERIDEKYEPVQVIPDFGQAQTNLRLYRRKP